MRIDAAALVADRFRYESAPTNGKKDHVELGRSGGVTGFYELGSAHVVDAAAAFFEVVSSLFHIEGAAIAVTRASRLEQVKLLLSVPEGAEPTSLHLEVEMAALMGAQYTDADVALQGDVTLEKAVASLSAGKLSVQAATLVARDVRLTVIGAGLTFVIGRIEAKAVSYAGGRVEVTELTVAEAAFRYDFTVSPAAAPTESAALPDLPLLDGIEGNVAIDVTLKADVPVLPDRVLREKLRIPIAGGALSFAALEHGLSTLGDALLDFEVVGDELILELDIVPILKADNVTLASWSLADPVDRELAAQKRVRLRRLVQAKTPPAQAPQDPGKKKAFRLLGLELAPIDVDLSLPKPQALELGGGTVRLTAIEALKLGGQVHVAIEGEPAPGRLDASVRRLRGTVDGVKLGPATIVRASMDVEAIEPLRIELDDLTPREIGGTIRVMKVEGLGLVVD